MNKIIATGAICLGFMGLGAGAANATTPDPVTIVAWVVADATNVWGVPQTYFTSATLAAPDLTALDGIACAPTDVTYQIDQYNSGATTDALIAGGILTGPNNPTEDLIAGGDGVAYKLITIPACVVPPVVVPPVVTPPVVEPPVVEVPAVDVVVSTPDELAYTADEPNYAGLVAGLGAVMLGLVLVVRDRLKGRGVHVQY